MNGEVSLGNSHSSEVLNDFKSRYNCIHQPQPFTKVPYDRRYLPSLWVFERRDQVDGPESPLPQSFSNLMVDHNILDTHIVTERITSVLKVLRFRKQRVLVQFWSPVPLRKKWLLIAWDQPFGLCEADEGLSKYRFKSEQLAIVVSRENREPDRRARVYSQQLPEWSLNDHGGDAWDDIHGYIDLPVFEYCGGCCVGVLEIITSSDYVDYSFEVEEVSKALKEQNLRSPNIFEDPRSCIADGRRQHALDQIFKAMKTVCDIHNLPLAQTWALSGCSSYVANAGNLEKSCGSFNRRCIRKVCMSTADLPFYVRDLSMWEYHEASKEQHLEISRGVVGRSLSSCSTVFCGDVTELDEDDYPLVPIACMSGITSCLAIYVKSLEMNVEYVMEIFVPTHYGTKAGIRRLIETVKQQIDNASWIQLDITSPPQVIGGVPLNWDMIESPPSPITLLIKNGEEEPKLENTKEDNTENEQSNSIAGVKDIDINPRGTKKNYSDISKATSRKTKRSEKLISLEEVRKHYGKTMDEAAASLNVSRSTLKRICRNFGIPRWPYKNGSDKGDNPVIKFNQTDVIVNTSEGAPDVVINTSEGAPDVVINTSEGVPSLASNEPVVGTTNITNDPAILTNNGMHTFIHVLPQQEQPNLPGEFIEPEIAMRGKPIKSIAPNIGENVTIKATYGNNTVRFPFSPLDGLVKLKELVATRFHLKLGSFSLKYTDEDDEMILVGCDVDLVLALQGPSGQSGTVIRLFVQLDADPSTHV